MDDMSHVNVGDQVVLAVQVRDGQYHLKPPHAQLRGWPASEHGLLTGDESWIAILVGQDWGTVTVEIDSRHTSPPDIPEDWEMATERSFATNASPHVTRQQQTAFTAEQMREFPCADLLEGVDERIVPEDSAAADTVHRILTENVPHHIPAPPSPRGAVIVS
jgi:hypothetical protein